MGNFIDLTGKRFGKLTVLHRGVNGKKVQWVCKCDCGKVTTVQGINLTNGHTRSCGCLISESNTKHGQWNTRLYRIYHAMKQRCYNSNCAPFPHYGGRGITICPEWKNDFQAFHDWAMSHGYSDELTIDRIDVNGNYEPGNCRWTTKTWQSFNRGKGKDNSSGIVGVSFRKDTGKYMAYISKAGKRRVLGNCDTLEEAASARKQAEQELY